MKRADIKTGDVLAYRRGPSSGIQQVTVLTDRPLVSTYPRYGWSRLVDKHDITLADGTTIQAPAREPASYDSAAEKGVLVRFEASGTVTVVRLATLVGTFAAVSAAEEAATAKRVADREAAVARSQAAYQEYVALRERVQALIPQARVQEDTGHVSLSRATLAALLDLAEQVTPPTAVSSVDHPQES